MHKELPQSLHPASPTRNTGLHLLSFSLPLTADTHTHTGTQRYALACRHKKRGDHTQTHRVHTYTQTQTYTQRHTQRHISHTKHTAVVGIRCERSVSRMLCLRINSQGLEQSSPLRAPQSTWAGQTPLYPP